MAHKISTKNIINVFADMSTNRQIKFSFSETTDCGNVKSKMPLYFNKEHYYTQYLNHVTVENYIICYIIIVQAFKLLKFIIQTNLIIKHCFLIKTAKI